MKLYINENTDPYFNLASEEYLLEHEDEPVFMLWRNGPSVIIGRNQNAYSEIDRGFTESHGIAVVRRLTGGGAVFHDLGNINFTFTEKRENCPGLDFGRFCEPIIKALRALGVPAELSGRNDMTADGRKFSGNAQCFYKDKVMHHGTILFSADTAEMTGALRVDPEKLSGKGIKSVRSRVCNLSEYLSGMDVTRLKEYLESSVPSERTEFSAAQIAGIEELKRTKYATWEWNFGRSHEFTAHVKRRFPFGSVTVSYTADAGRLTEEEFSGDFFGILPPGVIEGELVGRRLVREELIPALSRIGERISGAEPGQIADMFLSGE